MKIWLHTAKILNRQPQTYIVPGVAVQVGDGAGRSMYLTLELPG